MSLQNPLGLVVGTFSILSPSAGSVVTEEDPVSPSSQLDLEDSLVHAQPDL